MRKVIRIIVGASALSLLILSSSSTAKAAFHAPEEGIAGIALSLDNYRQSSEDGNVEGEADKALAEILMTKIISPYANLGVSTADNYVNVRQKPNTESEIVGKLYRGCAADILDRVDDWVKIKSGDVEGYINTDFLAIGHEAENLIEEYATKYVRVNTETLRVREKKSVDSRILTLIPEGEEYIVVKEYKEWVEILLGSDEQNGEDFTGFVSKEFIEIRVEFEYAISIEEENRRIAAEEAARKAEEERLQKLAEEKAKRAEEERRAAERRRAEEEARRNQSNNNKNNTSGGSSSNSSNGSSSNSNSKPNTSNKENSAIRQEIVNYALKFKGNPYVYGGTSLTKGADCSGFTSSIYRDFGYSIARDSRSQAASSGRTVNKSDILPGDLIFYASSSGTVNHVALYIGNGRIVHAANSRQGIIESQANYRTIYKVKRIVN